MIKIHLFGIPAVLNDDQPIKIQRRIQRAMLYYIAANERPVSTDHLIDTFWEPDLYEKGRKNIRDHISKMRAPLGADDIIQVRNGILQLDRKNIWVDWLEFKTLATKLLSTNPLATPLTAENYQRLLRAVELWNGHELIENDEVVLTEQLYEWLEAFREESHNYLLRILPTLAQHEILMGNTLQAIQWLTKATRLNEYDDNINFALLNAYIQARLFSEARLCFQSLKRIYLEDLKEPIPPKIASLEARIDAMRSEATQPVQVWNIHPGIPVPFIGQGEPLKKLRTALERTGAALVLGESGSGKTRLLYEFSRTLPQKTRTLVASCQPMESNLPFSTFASLLRTGVPREEWQALNAAWARPLTLLLPELTIYRPELDPYPADHPELPRTMLLEAIYRILLQLSEKQHIVVILDDIHWADESTLAMVSYLLKQAFFAAGQAHIILSARAEERSSLLDHFLTTSQQIQRVEPHQLNAREAAELSYFVLRHEIPTAFAEKLSQDTGGNPLFLLQILQSIQENTHLVDFSNTKDVPLPATLINVIQQRLGGLSHPAQEYLTTAAVIGSRFHLDLLEKAATISPENQPKALDELLRARLIQPIDEEKLEYGFVHEKLREGLLQQANLARKRVTHRKVAAALESSLGSELPARAAILAHHYEQAGMYARAFDYWIMAGQHDWILTSKRAAMDAFQNAERLIPRTSDLSLEQIYKLYVYWNQVAFENDDFATLERLNRSLLAIGKERDNNLLVGAALSGLSDAEMARNQFPEALEYARQAYQQVKDSTETFSKHEQARALIRQGIYLYMMGQMRASQPLFWQVLELTTDASEYLTRVEHGNAFYQLAITDALMGYPARALVHAQNCLNAQLNISNTYGQASAYSVMSLSYYLQGEYTIACETCLKGLELAESTEGWRMFGYLACYYSMNSLELGKIDDAWHYAHKAIDFGRNMGHGEIEALGCRFLGEIYLRLGNFPKAEEYFQRGIASAGAHFAALENAYRYGYVLALAAGQPEVGRHYMAQSIEQASKLDLNSIAILGSTIELDYLARVNYMNAFNQRAEWLRLKIIEHAGIDYSSNIINRFLAPKALRDGDPALAITLATPLLDWNRRSKNVWQELEMLNVIEKASSQLAIPAPDVRPRIDEIVTKIERSLQKTPLQDDFAVFRQRFAPK
jgi:predicted ATPase/DNA-binding SARP family transcriptional activator